MKFIEFFLDKPCREDDDCEVICRIEYGYDGAICSGRDKCDCYNERKDLSVEHEYWRLFDAA